MDALSDTIRRASEEGWNYVPGGWADEAAALEKRLAFIKRKVAGMKRDWETVRENERDAVAQAGQDRALHIIRAVERLFEEELPK